MKKGLGRVSLLPAHGYRPAGCTQFTLCSIGRGKSSPECGFRRVWVEPPVPLQSPGFCSLAQTGSCAARSERAIAIRLIASLTLTAQESTPPCPSAPPHAGGSPVHVMWRLERGFSSHTWIRGNRRQRSYTIPPEGMQARPVDYASGEMIVIIYPTDSQAAHERCWWSGAGARKEKGFSAANRKLCPGSPASGSFAAFLLLWPLLHDCR